LAYLWTELRSAEICGAETSAHVAQEHCDVV